MNIDNKERLTLLGLVRESIRKGNLEKQPTHGLDGVKPRKKYGLSKMTTLYQLEYKLIIIKD